MFLKCRRHLALREKLMRALTAIARDQSTNAATPNAARMLIQRLRSLKTGNGNLEDAAPDEEAIPVDKKPRVANAGGLLSGKNPSDDPVHSSDSKKSCKRTALRVSMEKLLGVLLATVDTPST